MKKHCLALVVALSAASGFAADSITYKALLDQSAGDGSPRSLMGKSVTVAAVGFGELGFHTAQGKELTFVCKSGDASLTQTKKPKIQTFTGMTVSAQGWDGATVWSLADCKAGTVANQASAASASSGSTVKIKGNGDSSGSPGKTSLQTLEGTVFSDKDPGGWYFGLKTAGKKPIRLSYAGDPFNAALTAMEDKGQRVKVTGFLGQYPGGYAAFDNARDVDIQIFQQ